MTAPVPSQTETLLLDIWQRVLGVPEIGRDSNFFDLGGDSLLAVNLFLEIEKQRGVTLPITAIYDAPTVAEMAAFIAEQTALPGTAGVPPASAAETALAQQRLARPLSLRDAGGTPAVPGKSSSPLVLLKPGTDDRPLFIVHGIGGTVFELGALGRAIRISDAVYAIQARGLDGREAPDETIEAMVEHYVAAIRTVQPFGPYRLCGYSFGGLVAMEMARRLKAQGQSVGALILMDAYAHPFTWPALSRLKMKLRRSLHLLRRAFRCPPAETLSRLRALAKPKSQSAKLREWLLDQNPSLPTPLLRVREAGGMALLAYRPKPYTGPIAFLGARERDIEFPDDAARIWRRLALDISFRTVPGGHRTIVTQHADTAAAVLTECLNGPSASFLRVARIPKQENCPPRASGDPAPATLRSVAPTLVRSLHGVAGAGFPLARE